MKYFVTGAAGFIGSHLVDRLLRHGHEVVGYDNFTTGRHEFLYDALQSLRFTLVTGDTLSVSRLAAAMRGSETVFHFAANADVRHGAEHPRRDLEQNTLATLNVLGAMRENGVKRIVFASSSAVYGEARVIPTPEDAPFPVQTSLYGASKLACEGLITAYAEAFDFRAHIFRFASVVGARYTHGHIVDFFRALRANPARLVIQGDGGQRKSYLDVTDCIDGVLNLYALAQERVNIFNLGNTETVTVDESADIITDMLGVNPVREYTGGARGWVGDAPVVHLDCARAHALGWQPLYTIAEGIQHTLHDLMEREGVVV